MIENKNAAENVGNTVVLEGFVVSPPVFHHTSYGEGIHEMTVSIPRLNADVTDELKVEVSDRLLDLSTLTDGTAVRIEGQFRSFNKKGESRVHLRLFVFAKEVKIIDGTTGVNDVVLNGFLCKDARYRKTPKGREICDMLVAVPRSYGKSDYIPCISWGRNARFTSNLNVGCGVTLEGRIQSRKYRKRLPDGEFEERIAYEVSTSNITVFQDTQDTVEDSE